MGRAISVPQRQVIFQRAGLGHQADAIADDLGLKPDTVRRLIARLRQAGAAGIAPDYSRCGANQARRADADQIAAAVAMRRQHPSWGAGIIRVILAEQHPGRTLPAGRTIQRAFAKVWAESALPLAGVEADPSTPPGRTAARDAADRRSRPDEAGWHRP